MARDLQTVVLEDRAVAGVEDAARSLARRRQGRRQTAQGRPAAGLGDRRQDRLGRSRHGQHDRHVRPPGRPPLLAAVYYTEGPESMDARNAVNKEIGALIAETF